VEELQAKKKKTLTPTQGVVLWPLRDDTHKVMLHFVDGAATVSSVTMPGVGVQAIEVRGSW